ncbi:MAG: hypothetical protein ACREC9_03405 [Methylocella sp.]
MRAKRPREQQDRRGVSLAILGNQPHPRLHGGPVAGGPLDAADFVAGAFAVKRTRERGPRRV